MVVTNESSSFWTRRAGFGEIFDLPFLGSAAVGASPSNPPTPEGSRRAGPCKKERLLGNRGLQERFTTSIRPGAEVVKANT